ncbi:hypothetical protein Tco_0985558 [Tanacetum coccineum]
MHKTIDDAATLFEDQVIDRGHTRGDMLLLARQEGNVRAIHSEDKRPTGSPQGSMSGDVGRLGEKRRNPRAPRALVAEMRDVASSLHHSLHLSGTPPLLPIPLTTPTTSREVGESSAAAAARQPRPTMAHRVDHSLVDVRSRESSEFYSRHHDAQKDRAAVRAEIEVLRRERLAYEQESMETRQALARSEAYCRALEARVTVLETEVRRHEWQRQAADDLAVQYIMRTQALEAGARVDTLEDTGSSS